MANHSIHFLLSEQAVKSRGVRIVVLDQVRVTTVAFIPFNAACTREQLLEELGLGAELEIDMSLSKLGKLHTAEVAVHSFLCDSGTLNFDEGIHGFTGRALHDDVERKSITVCLNQVWWSDMFQYELLNFGHGDAVRNL